MALKLRANKNVLNFSAQDALGSPPPELPNYNWIVPWGSLAVNVTLVIRMLRKSNASLELSNAAKLRMKLEIC